MSSFLHYTSNNNLRNLEANQTLIKIFNIIGNVFALIFFATPFIQIIKKKLYKENHINEMPLLLILSIIFNCLFWLLNAFSSEDKYEWIPLFVSNIGGLAINTLLLFFYLFFFLHKEIKPFLGYGFFVLDLIVEITYLMFRYIILPGGKNTFHLIGFIATIINVVMYLSPIQNICIIIKRWEYRALPIYTLIIGFFSTMSFFIQGIISYCGSDDENEKRIAVETMVSNGVSFFLLGCLVGVYSYFYIKRGTQKIDTDKEHLKKGIDNPDHTESTE